MQLPHAKCTHCSTAEHLETVHNLIFNAIFNVIIIVVMSGLKWSELSIGEKERLKRLFPVSGINDLVRYENGFLMPRRFVDKGLDEKIFNFQLKEDDNWVCSFPKSGTTWTQELVWMLVNDVDQEAAKL